MKTKKYILAAIAALIIPSFTQAAPQKGAEKQRPSPEQVIQRLDTNGDKQISRAEAEAAPRGKLAEHFETIDADGNGQLTAPELAKAGIKQRIAKADADQSGTLSRAEAEAAGMERFVEKFETLDANGDGEVSREEMTDARGSSERSKEGKQVL